MSNIPNYTSSKSCNPADYFYVDTSSTHNRMYFDVHTKKCVSVQHLSIAVLAAIKPKASKLKPLDKLLLTQTRLEQQSIKLNTKLDAVRRDIKEATSKFTSGMNQQYRQDPSDPPVMEFSRKFKSYADWKEQTDEQNDYAEPRAKKQKVEGCADAFLCSMHITTKKQWRDWLRLHHPDKLRSEQTAMEDDLCKRVLESGKCF